MFSDHGMNLEKNCRISLVTHLRRKNFKVSSELNNGGRVVSIPAFGLCSYAAAYCADEALIPEVAAAVVEIRGVDFVVFRNDGGVMLQSSRGDARLERNADNRYCYAPTTGDPLELKPAMASLGAEGKIDAAGFCLSR